LEEIAKSLIGQEQQHFLQTVICAEDLFFEVGRNLRKETGHRELDAWLVFNLFGLCQSRRFDASGLSPSIGVTNRESCLSLSKVADSKRDRSDVGHLDLERRRGENADQKEGAINNQTRCKTTLINVQ